MFKRRGGGVKGFLNNVQKTALFLRLDFPYTQGRTTAFQDLTNERMGCPYNFAILFRASQS